MSAESLLEPELEPLTERLPNVPELPNPDEVREALSAQGRDAAQVEEIVWLLNEGRARGLTTYSAIGALIRRDASTISRVMRGVYVSDISPLAADVKAFRVKAAQLRAQADEEPFVPQLSVVRSIVPFCDLARAARQIGIVWGKNQSGKTSALRYYASQNDDTVYCKLPAGGGTNKSMAALATAAGISARKSDSELWARLLKRFTSGSLLIIDEWHQAVHAGRRVQTVTVDRIREIHDDCGCGVVLCGTEHVQEAMENDKLREFLGQVDNRGALRLCLPGGPQPGDLDLLYDAYGLPAPDAANAETVSRITEKHGIARLTDYFKIARRLAIKAGEGLEWGHFRKTHATLTSWAGPKNQRKGRL